MAEQGDIANTPGWRTGLLFLLFAAISVLLERGTEWLEHRFSRTRGHARSNGLLTMITFIKQELFLLGLISMVLTAVQGPMLRICIPDNAARYGLGWNPEPENSKYGNAVKDAGRRLLGAAPGGDVNFCAKGYQPLFSAYLLYQVHLLIFLFAVIHVVYVFGTVMVTLLQMRQWHRWEEEAPTEEEFLRVSGGGTGNTPRKLTAARPATAKAHERALRHARRSARNLWRRVGTSGFSHAVRVAVAVVTHDVIHSPVNRAVYYALRLMFIDRLGLDQSFDFANFVERSIEEHIPLLMKLNAAMLCLAAALLSFPFPAYLPYWLFGISVLVELLLAGKLSSITTLLAAQALSQFCADDNLILDDGAFDERLPSANPSKSAPRGPPGQLEICVVGGPPSSGGGGTSGPRSTPDAAGWGPDTGAGAALRPARRAAAPYSVPSAVSLPRADQQLAVVPGGGPAAGGGAAAAAALRRNASDLEARLETRLEGPSPTMSNDSMTTGLPPNGLRPIRTVATAVAQAHASDGRAIARAIQAAATLDELDALTAAYGERFTQVHVSLALLQLHRIAEGRVIPRATPQLPLPPPLLANTSSLNQGPPGEPWGDSVPAAAGTDGSYAGSQYAWDQLQTAADAAAGTDQDRAWAAAAADAGPRGSGGALPRSGTTLNRKAVEAAAAAAAAAEQSVALPPAPRSPSAASAVWSTTSGNRRRRVMQRVDNLPLDPSKHFWGGRPRLLLYLFQIVFYSNSFLLTLAMFAFWQKHAGDWHYTGVGLTATLLLMCGSILLAIHSALRVLPLFALVEPMGRHAPENVIRRALKEGGLQAEEAAALAAQLGVALPPMKQRRGRASLGARLRRLSRGSGGDSPGALLEDANAPPEQRRRARGLLQRLLDLGRSDSKHRSSSGGGGGAPPASGSSRRASLPAGVGGGGGLSDDDDSGPSAPRRDHPEGRRSLEEIKTATFTELLQLLSLNPGQLAAAGGGGAGSAALGGGPQGLRASGSLQSPDFAWGGGTGAALGPVSPNPLARPKSTPNLGQLVPGGSASGPAGARAARGGAHGGGDASSNATELAGEMLRAIILKHARAGQPLTPHAGGASSSGPPVNRRMSDPMGGMEGAGHALSRRPSEPVGAGYSAATTAQGAAAGTAAQAAWNRNRVGRTSL